MNSIKYEVRIKASASKVYAALTRQDGYRGWWNAVAEVPAALGGEAKLRFVMHGNPVNMRFRIEEMKADDCVRWTCIANDEPSWIGTTLTWRIREAGGEVVVSLDHSGWKGEVPDTVTQGWKHFTGSLKTYVETGSGHPA